MRPSVRQTVFIGALAALSAACEAGGVGDPCTPEDEYQNAFSGFSVDEVNIESRSFQCETRVCLVDHFQGRVSCPFGQSADQLGLASNDPKRCRIPGTSGDDPNDGITVPVNPQREDRRPKDAVYCSCRCDGPDPNAKYCECPSGFDCVPLVDDLGLGKGQLAGSYCQKTGKGFEEGTTAPKCVAGAGNCGDATGNPPYE